MTDDDREDEAEVPGLSGDETLPLDPSDTPHQRLPTVECSRCDRTWDLSFELDEQHAGNQALQQFAMDHHRHTGHFPDDVTPWVADCRHCPKGEQYLSERPAKRFAKTHARHTGHTVSLDSPGDEDVTLVGAEPTETE